MSDPRGDEQFCKAMLPKVSRTFALTIRLLPDDIAHSVTVAYLLCRIADTIEDHAALRAEAKGRLLRLFRESLRGGSIDAAALCAELPAGDGADRHLTCHADVVLREFQRLPPAHRDAVTPWVEEMCDGMAHFARLMEARGGGQQMLDSVTELEQYCYYVAGTVGHLLTGLFLIRTGPLPAARETTLRQLAPNFGLGLQLTNIAQDFATDASRGVTFVPREWLGNDAARASALGEVIDLALQRLRDGRAYCLNLPGSQYRIRLFCLCALYFALKTLRMVKARLASADQSRKAKISRRDVYATLAMTALVAPSNVLLSRYFDSLERLLLEPVAAR